MANDLVWRCSFILSARAHGDFLEIRNCDATMTHDQHSEAITQSAPPVTEFGVKDEH
jgi:hypothetical protein